MPTRRWGLAASSVGNKIYAIGGANGIWNPLTNNEVYDVLNDSWSTAAPMPTGRLLTAAAAVQGRIYVIGGRGFGGDKEENEEYNPATDNWTSKAPCPAADWFNGLGVAHGKIYAVGSHATYEYDPANDSWRVLSNPPDMPWDPGVTSLNDKVYAFGGTDHGARGALPYSYVLDPLSGNWTKLANMTMSRADMPAIGFKGRLFAIGGELDFGGNEVLDTNAMYDPVSNTWTNKTPMPTPRDEMPIAVVGDAFYVIGGSPESWSHFLNENERYLSALTFNWDFGDGTPHSSDKVAMHSYSAPGSYIARLEVKDSEGAIGGDTATVIVSSSNRPPVANAGTVYSGSEGFPIDLDGASSSDPDGDSLQFRWDFENDGIWDTNWSISTRFSHTWGDDFTGMIALEVSDGSLTDTDVADVVVGDVLPSGMLGVATIDQQEGTIIHFNAHVTDPGSDDIFLRWSWGDGTPDETSTYYNDGVGPDPYPSTDIHPRDITDVKSHTYGDNGEYTVSVFVSDDDSGSDGTRLAISATPDNLPPSVTVAGGTSIDEGQSVMLTATATDPGSDDLTFAWSWGEGSNEKRVYFNDGANPDPPQSPGGKWPFTAIDTATHPYGDNGLYPVTLTVTDDDGGSSSWSCQVVVKNLPPRITPFGPFTVNEGDPVSISATAMDAGSDDLTFTWNWDYGPTDTATFYNDGIGPDPSQSPFGTYPFTATDDSSHMYGDDCPCNFTLTVTDDDGGTATYTMTVNVFNLPPSLAGEIEAYAKGSLILRVAGEKWHDVTATIYRNGVEEMVGEVVRTPGSPDDQAVTLGDVTFDLLSSDIWSAKVVYTPEDDPVNGQPNGADPAWIIFRSEHGSESRLHHTFNVQHSETWMWDVPDLKALLFGIPLDFTATATDPGSDDLTFTWDWGDGTPATATTNFNDGVGPDPYPSLGGTFPFTATDRSAHAYSMAGTFTATLRVSDDDGGWTEIILIIDLD